MSFSPLFVKIFCRSSGSLANRHVDNFVHKLFTSLLIYYHAFYSMMFVFVFHAVKEGANKRGNSSRLTQSFHFFMFEPIFSPVNALNQP
uniref:hypothetical protein n=1 Tax=Escherichia coli TaxID=562 RepID=UPI001966B6C8